MKVLFLDDDSSRCDVARVRFEHHEYFEAHTAQEANDILDRESPFTLVLLDHDLGGQVYTESDEKSGYAVAKHITELPDEKIPRRVVIHSYNPVGAEKMLNLLSCYVENVNYIPFGT